MTLGNRLAPLLWHHCLWQAGQHPGGSLVITGCLCVELRAGELGEAQPQALRLWQATLVLCPVEGAQVRTGLFSSSPFAHLYNGDSARGGAAGDEVYKALGVVPGPAETCPWLAVAVSTNPSAHEWPRTSQPTLRHVPRLLPVIQRDGLADCVYPFPGCPCPVEWGAPSCPGASFVMEAPARPGGGGVWQGSGRAQRLSPDEPDGQLPGTPQALAGFPHEHRLHLAALLPLLPGRSHLPLLRHLAGEALEPLWPLPDPGHHV